MDVSWAPRARGAGFECSRARMGCGCLALGLGVSEIAHCAPDWSEGAGAGSGRRAEACGAALVERERPVIVFLFASSQAACARQSPSFEKNGRVREYLVTRLATQPTRGSSVQRKAVKTDDQRLHWLLATRRGGATPQKWRFLQRRGPPTLRRENWRLIRVRRGRRVPGAGRRAAPRSR